MQQQTILDIQVLTSLQSLMDQDAFTHLLSAFLTRSQQHVCSIRRHFAGKEYESLHRVAHTLKGSSANLGFVQLSGRCAELEKHLKAGDIISAPLEMLVDSIESDYLLARTALEQFMQAGQARSDVA